MKNTLSVIALVAALPAFAEETRQLDAHEHGVGTLDIAIEGTAVAMEFHAPGADIVGFEYEAKSEADLAKIKAALETLGTPLSLFAVPDAAACSVVSASAELESEEEHDEHHEEGHAEEGHKDHDHDDDHEKHDEHDHDEHKDHDHEEHDEHAGEDSGHTEFHAEYALTCENPDALTELSFGYFDAFPNAKEVEVQIVTASGAQAYEVERDAPNLDLGQ